MKVPGLGFPFYFNRTNNKSIMGFSQDFNNIMSKLSS